LKGNDPPPDALLVGDQNDDDDDDDDDDDEGANDDRSASSNDRDDGTSSSLHDDEREDEEDDRRLSSPRGGRGGGRRKTRVGGRGGNSNGDRGMDDGEVKDEDEDEDEDGSDNYWTACYAVSFNRRGSYLSSGHASGLVGVHDFLGRGVCAMYRPPVGRLGSVSKMTRTMTTRIAPMTKTMKEELTTKTATTTNDGDVVMGGAVEDVSVPGAVDEKEEKTGDDGIEGGDGGGSGWSDTDLKKRRMEQVEEHRGDRKEVKGGGAVASSTDALPGLVDVVPPKPVSVDGAEVGAENNDAPSAGHGNAPSDVVGVARQFSYLNGVTSLSWDRHSRTLLAGAIGDRNLRLMDNT
jgi:hypothetical protein